MLDIDETIFLINKSQEGNKDALQTIIKENMPLIKSVVKRFSGKSIEYDDLLQLGSLGLIKAIMNFDVAFNVMFSTYAVPMIAGEIKRYIRDDGSMKVSRALKLLAYNIGKYIDEYQSKYNKEPTIKEISEKFSVEQEDVILALDSSRLPLSLDDKPDDDGLSLMDKITDNNDEENRIDKIVLFELIKNLEPRDKKIIYLRYFRDRTQSEVAKILGVSQVQVSRLENKIILNFRENF